MTFLQHDSSVQTARIASAFRLGKLVFAVVFGLGFAVQGPAFAGDIVLGFGQDNVDHDEASEASAFQFEYHSNDLRSYSWGSVSAMGVVEADGDDDLFTGGGLSVQWNTSDKWFVEGSLAAGYYSVGNNGLDLGGKLQFRTLVGIGMHLSDASRVSVAVDHLSNAGLESTNPGRNAVFLRYLRSF